MLFEEKNLISSLVLDVNKGNEDSKNKLIKQLKKLGLNPIQIDSFISQESARVLARGNNQDNFIFSKSNLDLLTLLRFMFSNIHSKELDPKIDFPGVTVSELMIMYMTLYDIGSCYKSMIDDDEFNLRYVHNCTHSVNETKGMLEEDKAAKLKWLNRQKEYYEPLLNCHLNMYDYLNDLTSTIMTKLLSNLGISEEEKDKLKQVKIFINSRKEYSQFKNLQAEIKFRYLNVEKKYIEDVLLFKCAGANDKKYITMANEVRCNNNLCAKNRIK